MNRLIRYAHNALELFLNSMRYINPRFTYLLTSAMPVACNISTCINVQPHSHLMSPFQRTQALYCQKLQSLSYMFATDSMGLSAFVFMQ